MKVQVTIYVERYLKPLIIVYVIAVDFTYLEE